MTCVHKFFEDNYDELVRVARRYVRDYAHDLVHDLALFYLEEDRPNLQAMCEKGELMSYICRTMAICGFSKTTRFYYKYKKHREPIVNLPLAMLANKENDVDNEYDTTELIAYINSILLTIDWFDAEVFRIYYTQSHSLKTLSNATGISKSTLYNALKKAQEQIKEKVKGFRRHDRKDN